MSIETSNRRPLERTDRPTRHYHLAGSGKAPARRRGADDVPGNAVAVEVYEALVDAVGLANARTALHVLSGYAPTLQAIDRVMARRRLPDLMAKRPDLSTRALARLLGVSHATVQRWLGETGTASGTRSTEGR